MQKVYKILITGPESTGKSTLCKALAEKYDTQWIKEYAREYIDQVDRKYVYSDLKIIAQKQSDFQEKAILLANTFLFCDTGLEVLKIWSENSFQKCDQWILDNLSNQKFDLVLLTDIDTPWQFDEQREHPKPEQRSYFIDLYKKELTEIYGGYHLIQGNEEERLEAAIKYIETLIIK
ncbi:AAA family ATPase [Flammeovirga kamogawensis]|uniref:ATP-binding protein n=1 Tax=Flammeovirga kamogawensis TaxID=373891 RepID=A0ABX8GZK8_9BACT|nr:ATP-binding protein [Flammeovirga kamogawensis]MBB6459228.1 NadR type nicotinamide-nucleotide adenylyltransferase [Flammeovirga kamogawensis]QWG08792.1 ATP-binding protein [Flammeovirga kamogawensis]TRX67082.1 ATP-binding protein [Flammeovirga kamogawensis]